MSADCREWVVLLDQCKGISVSSLRCHLDITLNSDMCRTGCLTRSCTCIITVDAVLITIVFVPHLRSPFLLCWKNMLRILYLRTIFLAKLLTKLNSTSRAILYTTSASHTVLCLYLCNICRSVHIRCIK